MRSAISASRATNASGRYRTAPVRFPPHHTNPHSQVFAEYSCEPDAVLQSAAASTATRHASRIAEKFWRHIAKLPASRAKDCAECDGGGRVVWLGDALDDVEVVCGNTVQVDGVAERDECGVHVS